MYDNCSWKLSSTQEKIKKDLRSYTCWNSAALKYLIPLKSWWESCPVHLKLKKTYLIWYNAITHNEWWNIASNFQYFLMLSFVWPTGWSLQIRLSQELYNVLAEKWWIKCKLAFAVNYAGSMILQLCKTMHFQSAVLVHVSLEQWTPG